MKTVIDLLIAFVVSTIASCCFGIIFHAPKKEIFPAGFVGGLGWLVYIILTGQGVSVTYASFFATLALAIVARILSVARKNPVTIFLITGIFPLVPGIGIYNTGYSLFMNSNNLQTLNIGLQTVEIAIAIALGIGVVMSLPSVFFKWALLLSGKSER